jgi:ABC-2 type transport system permease protein
VIIGPIYRLTLRALLLQRRTILLGLLAAAPVLMAFVYAVAARADADHVMFYSHLVQQLFVPTIAALVALVIGVSAIGDEREDGTILYLVATPQSRLGLIATKIAAAWTATLVLLVPSLVASALLILKGATDLSSLTWPLAGLALATLAYCAVAAWLSLRTRRPIVIGVLYILLWEGSIATFAASASKLSIAAYGRALVAERLPEAAAPVVGPAPAVVILAAAAAVTCWLGARALVRAEL